MSERRCLVCNCEKTMELDGDKLSSALASTGAELQIGGSSSNVFSSLCRVQLDRFEAALESASSAGEGLTVCCTQEAPLFSEIASEAGFDQDLTFVNIRENAGWSKQGKDSLPKIAALIAASAVKIAPARLKEIHSNGLCLVYGAGDLALEVAQNLNKSLSVSLLLSDDEPLEIPTQLEIPIHRGEIVKAEGTFGQFSITVDNYAALRPSSRDKNEFSIPRNGAKSDCSLIVDLSGKTPLFSSKDHRTGYWHIDSGDVAGLFRLLPEISAMVGEFEKPIYVDHDANLCAHSRSQITGCTKCIDVCPASAITSAMDIVAIDNNICGGCGSCFSVCPSGAIEYNYPDRDGQLARAFTLLDRYNQAGGHNPVILIHDDLDGAKTIAALARYSNGLPANMLPLSQHSVTAMGHVEWLAIMAKGASGIVILGDGSHLEELQALESEIALANTILDGLGLGNSQSTHKRIELLVETNPDILETRLWADVSAPVYAQGSMGKKVATKGSKREVSRLMFSALHEQSTIKPDQIDLPPSAPYGRVEINEEACTLCMSCASACPSSAIMDTPDEPKLRFVEAACLQCGLCVNTCPENALTLAPQLDFTASALQPITLYEEEPFCCISCGKAFAAKSTIEHVRSRLSGSHSMFADPQRARLLEMCDDCRIETQANSSNDPFASGTRPIPRTTDDYLNGDEGNSKGKKLSADDFLKDS